MNIQQWWEKFLSEIYKGGVTNISPPALIRMIASASTEDAEEFKWEELKPDRVTAQSEYGNARLK